jgi:hypothetical protein
VRSGTCPGTQLACDDDGGGSLTSRISLSVTPGTYYIVVDGYSSSASGSYVLNVDVAATGDNCSQVRVISAAGTYSGTTCGMTGDFAGSCGGGTAPDVVFELDVPHPGGVTLDLRGSGFDTVLYVREAVCGTVVEAGCNDDYDATTVQSYFYDRLSRGLYYVVVDGKGTACGAFSLRVDY